MYLDLIGLPPTLEERDTLLRDPSPKTFDRLVSDLLARSGYGERWGRHWLDLVRYAESNSGVKSQRRFSTSMLAGLKAITQLPGLRRRILIYRGQRRLRTSEGIDIWPLEIFLDALETDRLWP